MKTLHVLATLLLLLFLLPACHKQSDDPDTGGGTRLRMMTIYDKEASDRTDFLVFDYDSLNRIDRYTDSLRFRGDLGSFTATAFPTTHVHYDQQGRISDVMYRERGSTNFPDALYQLWFYDNAGLVTKTIDVSEWERDTTTVTYTYDQNRRVVADTIFNNKHMDVVNFTTFVYDASDNVVKWSYHETFSGTTRLVWTADAVYDDHPNPFRTIGLYKLPFGGDISGLSRNNLLQATFSNGTTDKHQYRYYSNGLPQSDVNQYISGQTKTRSNNYYYD